MNNILVCILAHGSRNYYLAAEQAAVSVLKKSTFDLYLAHGNEHPFRLKPCRRMTVNSMDTPAGSGHRAHDFLFKFDALQDCLKAAGNHRIVLLMDADAVFVRKTREKDILKDLGDANIGMVEQTGITGSSMCRRDFLEHYKHHTLKFLNPGGPEPDPKLFRYFNSGVVFLRKPELEAFLGWALPTIQTRSSEHQVAEHMIADQDYFQFWVNSLHPGRCRQLPWYWNHCEHWDTEFPRKGARIAHFSNFCKGPEDSTAERMKRMRSGLSSFLDRFSGVANSLRVVL